MPVSYVINRIHRLVVSTAWARVTSAEILAHRDQLKNDPDFDPAFDQLVDGRGVTAVDVPLGDAKAIAGRTVFASTSRRAFVAGDLAVLSMARLMESYADREQGREEVRVFHDFASALAWLGLERVPESSHGS
jgi:hypothetical protein